MNQEGSVIKSFKHWDFDEKVSEIFDTHIRKSLPFYDEFQSWIGTISREVLPDNALVYDIGTATGEIIQTIHKANPTKQITFIGIDNSAGMLKKAEEKCRDIKNAHFYNEIAETFRFKPSDMIVAAFTLQFMKPENRGPLLLKIKKSLKPNSCFILCEKIKFECSFTNSMIENIHEEWKLNFYTKEEVLAKKNSLKNVMFPLSLEDNLNALKDAGFESINSVFQWGNFICILAK